MSSSDDHRVDAFDVLAHRRRKWIVLFLALLPDRTDTKTRLLAELVTVLETGEIPRDLDATAYGNVSASLSRGHVETLEDAGVVVEEENSLQPGPLFAQYAVLALGHEIVRQWRRL